MPTQAMRKLLILLAGLAALAVTAVPAAHAGVNSWTGLSGLDSPNADWVREYARDGTTMYAATEDDGVSRSTNNGVTWAPVNTGLTGVPGAKNVRTVFIDGGTVLAGTSAGLFKLSGSSWQPVAQGAEADPKNPKKLNTAVQALHSSGNSLLAGTFSSGVYKSTDGGNTWKPPAPGNGMPSATTVWQLTSIGNFVFAATSSGLYRSSDFGTSWTHKGDGIPGTTLRVFRDNDAPNIYYVATPGDGVYRSTDLGETWSSLNGQNTNGPDTGALGNGTVRGLLQFSGSDFTNLYAGTGNGLYQGTVTNNLGVGAFGGPIKWRKVTNTGLGGNTILWTLFSDAATPGTLLAGTQSNGGYHLQLTPPVNTVDPTISGTLTEGQTLTANPGTWQGTQTIEYEYQWERCTANSAATCSDIPDATSKTYLLTDDDKDRWIRVDVTAKNAVPDFGLFHEHSALYGDVAADPGNLPGNISAPAAGITTVTQPQPGKVVSRVQPTWFPSTEPGKTDSFTYQWFSCPTSNQTFSCVPIPGATGVSYTFRGEDVGRWVRVLVTGHNETGSRSSDNLSGATFEVLPPDPKQVAAPQMIGTPTVGQTLLATVGAWEWPGTNYKRQWESCNAQGQSCSTITGATGATYKPTANDVGDRLRVRLTVDSNGPNNNPAPVEVIVGPTAPVKAASKSGVTTPPPPPPPPPPVDKLAPVAKSLGLTSRKVRRGGTLRLRYDLSEAATLAIKVQRLKKGRKKGRKCVAGRRKGKRCTARKTVGTITLPSLSGAGTAAFKAKVRGKNLPAGSYRAVVTPVDAAGNKGKAKVIGFKVTKR